MKIRSDFVTNSSSSAFICLKVPYKDRDVLLSSDGLTQDDISKRWEEEYMDEISLTKAQISVVLGECGDIIYVGKNLSRDDMEVKPLKQIREELSAEIQKAYGIKINPESFEFGYGEISRG